MECMKITLVVTGRSYHLTKNIPPELELDEGSSLSDAISAIDGHLPREHPLPQSCLIAIGGKHVGTVGTHPPKDLRDGDELVIIAPVAGG
jgi:molybdopterin converting factor small subunit